jgi:hypothetical protein
VAKIFADNYSEVEYFDTDSKESGGSVVSGVQLETESTGCQFRTRIATTC